MAKTKNVPTGIQVKRASFGKYFLSHKWLYIMALPGIIWMLVFCYFPMFGIVIAFKDYSPYNGNGVVDGILNSPWVGLENFQRFFIGSDFTMLLWNTLSISLLSLLFYFPLPIILSLMLNEIKSQGYKRVTQTLVYIPHFVSMVIVASLTYQLFNSQDGAIYQIMVNAMGKQNAPALLTDPHWFATVIVGQSMWKEAGYGTIIFLAALSGVDLQLYEAARVDGAGRWKMMWHITLPSIRGTIVIMLILKVGSVLNTGYEQIFLMQNDLNKSASEVFDTYIYNNGVVRGRYSVTQAAGLFKSIVSLVMVLGSNAIAKACGESGFY